MFAALTLGRFHPRGQTDDAQDAKARPLTPIARASEMAIASLQGVLTNTCRVIDQIEAALPAQASPDADAAQTKVDTMRRRELRVVQSRAEIENPTIVYRARWIN
jgi:pyridoxine kinase